MKPGLRAKLDTILNYPFFQSVGLSLPSTVTAVSSWPMAVECCTSTKWENCQIMARNALDRHVGQRSWERGQEWNPLVQELSPILTTFLQALIVKTPISEQLISKVMYAIRWDLLFICLEEEYKDIVNPIFFIPQLEPLYSAGHFPCGWDGKQFPDGWDGVIREGKLIVF